MYALDAFLGVDGLLVEAEEALPAWVAGDARLAGLSSVEELLAVKRSGGCVRANEILLALARLAAVDGGNDPRAAAVLCRALCPGVVRVIAMTARRVPWAGLNQLNQWAAEQLWIECRQIRWVSEPRVAASVCWRVATQLLVEAGVGERDRVWRSTVLSAVELEPTTDSRNTAEEASAEWTEVAEAAVAAGAVTAEDVELLLELAHVSVVVNGRATAAGLMSERASTVVGRRHGWGPSTVRRRARIALMALRRVALAEVSGEEWMGRAA